MQYKSPSKSKSDSPHQKNARPVDGWLAKTLMESEGGWRVVSAGGGGCAKFQPATRSPLDGQLFRGMFTLASDILFLLGKVPKIKL